MRKVALLTMLCLFISVAHSQSKVFKEVSDEVSSEMKVIMQDNTLVGYLVFTQLEKASADSFNYKISLMDENLNEIGTVNFRDESLNLEAVSFDQDVLALAYIKSNIIGKEFKNKNEYRNYESKNAVFTQFITLDGKILKSNSQEIELVTDPMIDYYGKKKKFTFVGGVKNRIQLKNIPGEGFVCFYGDRNDKKLIAYDTKGNKIWEKNLSSGTAFSILTTPGNVFVLQKIGSSERYDLSNFKSTDGEENYEINLNDGKGNKLRVLNWQLDPVTNTPFMSGSIVNQKMEEIYYNKQFKKNPYIGVFTMDFPGSSRDSIQKKFTYWDNGSQSAAMTEKGLVVDPHSYIYMTGSFRDYNKNTYFYGTELIKRFKYLPMLITAAIVAPIVAPYGGVELLRLAWVPAIGALCGFSRWKARNTTLLKLSSKGALSYEQTLPADHSRFAGGNKSPSKIMEDRLIYTIDNPETKGNYIITADKKNIIIYSVKKKQTIRTIPQKSGKTSTLVFPAKEGHIMIFERNKAERYTRLSIERLN